MQAKNLIKRFFPAPKKGITAEHKKEALRQSALMQEMGRYWISRGFDFRAILLNFIKEMDKRRPKPKPPTENQRFSRALRAVESAYCEFARLGLDAPMILEDFAREAAKADRGVEPEPEPKSWKH